MGGIRMAYEIPPDKLADRASIVLTLFLTVVAFKFAISTEIPRLAYLSIMDRFILLVFAVFAFVMLQNTYAAALSTVRTAPHVTNATLDSSVSRGLKSTGSDVGTSKVASDLISKSDSELVHVKEKEVCNIL